MLNKPWQYLIPTIEVLIFVEYLDVIFASVTSPLPPYYMAHWSIFSVSLGPYIITPGPTPNMVEVFHPRSQVIQEKRSTESSTLIWCGELNGKCILYLKPGVVRLPACLHVPTCVWGVVSQ